MKQQIVVIHGGHAFDTYEEYLANLKDKEVTLERLSFRDWKKNLPEVLGSEYEVLAPQMPNAQNARYEEWKIWFEKFIPFLRDEIIFVGHSLGGIFLVKYLSENKFPKKIKATFLVAAPFNTTEEHPRADFIISKDLSLFVKQGGEIFIYHSKDDKVVPYSNVSSYERALPSAHAKTFQDRGHFNLEEFPEIVEDIRNLS